MPPTTPELHHVTGIAGDPQRNTEFYVDTLGLRFVKKTVNHDDKYTYHFYVGDAEGTPGTNITFFPWGDQGRPGRFGSVQSLFDTIDYCRDHDIQMFGGGQFELGVGREHIHVIASLFYPDAPNDVAPKAYNDPDLSGDLPTSPLAPPPTSRGLSWR